MPKQKRQTHPTKVALRRWANLTDEECALRRQQNAQQAAMARAAETAQQRAARLRKNAECAARARGKASVVHLQQNDTANKRRRSNIACEMCGRMFKYLQPALTHFRGCVRERDITTHAENCNGMHMSSGHGDVDLKLTVLSEWETLHESSTENGAEVENDCNPIIASPVTTVCKVEDMETSAEQSGRRTLKTYSKTTPVIVQQCKSNPELKRASETEQQDCRCTGQRCQVVCSTAYYLAEHEEYHVVDGSLRCRMGNENEELRSNEEFILPDTVEVNCGTYANVKTESGNGEVTSNGTLSDWSSEVKVKELLSDEDNDNVNLLTTDEDYFPVTIKTEVDPS